MNHAGPRQPTTIFDHWKVIQSYRWVIGGVVVAAVLITWAACKFYLPKIYEAKATLMPARQEATGGGISLGGGDKDKGGGGGGGMMMMEAFGSKMGPSIMDILHAILLSRTMAEAIVSQLNLVAYYNANSLAQATQSLQGETEVRISRYKTFEVTVMTRDPQVAATIANAYVANLDRLNQEFSISATKRNRLFLEQRLVAKSKTMAAAEEALKAYQTEHRTLVVTSQAEVAMEQVAEVHGQIVQLEVELAALREYATPSHPMINQLQVQIRELRSELDRLEQDQRRVAGATQRRSGPPRTKMLPTFENAPSLALELLRLTRQVKVEEAVYGMLIGMLEQARIAEMKDLPTVQVLDVAVPPERASRPRTLQNVLVAGSVSLVMGILLAYLFNYLAMVRAQEASSSVGAGDGLPAPVESNGNGDSCRVIGYSGAPKETERLSG